MRERDKTVDARTRRAAIVLALVAALLGLAGWLSWILEQPLLRTLGAGRAGMSPITALNLLGAAIGVVMAQRGARRSPGVYGAAAIAIAATVLVEWMIGAEHGIARFVLAPHNRSDVSARMSVPGAILFCVLGAALVLVRRGRTPLRRPSDYLAAVAALGAFTVVTAYAYGASTFAPVLGDKETGMSLPAAIGILSLAASLLLVDARQGLASILLADESGGLFARRLALLALLGPPGSGVLVSAARSLGIGDPLAELAAMTVFASAITIFAIAVAAHRLNVLSARRRHTEHDLRVAEGRLRGLIANAPDAILSVDEHGRVAVANRRAAELFGRDVIAEACDALIPELLSRTHGHEDAPLAADVVTDRGVVPVEVTFTHLETDGTRTTTLMLRDVSERRYAEQMLRMNEARFRLLFEYSTDGVFVATPEGQYVDVNEAGCRMLGATREEILGEYIQSFVPPEDVPRLLADRDHILAGGTQSSEWRLRRSDGSWIDVEVATRFLPNGRWVGLARDISARKAAEEKIRRAHESELHLRHQIEAISNATTAVSAAVTRLPQSDLRAVLHTVILQAMAITGARYGALGIGGDAEHAFDPWVTVGMPERTVRAIGKNPRARGVLATVALDSQLVRIDDLSRTPGFRGFPPGHPQLKTLLGVPIRYQGRSIGHLFLSEKADGTTFTADDQRALQILADRVALALETARLYEAEARERSWLQVTIDQMPEPVLLADGTGRVVSWNRAAAALARSEASAHLPFDLRWPNGAPISAKDDPLLRACLHGEYVNSVELIAMMPDGRQVPVLASASPLSRDERDAHGAVAILQDITHHKQLERLREEWTAIVAHDLRQPISSIALSAQLLQRRALAGDDAKLVERIRAGAERVRRMVDDLLDYAQIEAGRLRISPRPVDLKPLVAEVVDRVTPNTHGHPVRLVVEQIDAHIDADPGRIEQVLTNLMSNAAKYGFPGTEIVVTIGGRGSEIELTVENRGPGMSAEELGRLFARFGRMAAAEAMGVKGIGLGLFITKGIVEAHGGRIWAESTPFETTTFHVALPARPHRRAA